MNIKILGPGCNNCANLEKATRHPPRAPVYKAPTWDRHFAEVARSVGLAS